MTISSLAESSSQEILISSCLYAHETWIAACPYPLHRAVSSTYFCRLTLIAAVVGVLPILIFFFLLLHPHALQMHVSCALIQQALSKVHKSS
jgi:hypothetical protein